MPPAPHAVVSYAGGALGEFVHALRGELEPGQSHLWPHLTLLPARILSAAENSVITFLQEISRASQPIRITLGEVSSFLPASPTIFVEVRNGARHVRYLHDQFNDGILRAGESWPYVPHLTLAQLADNAAASRAEQLCRRRWPGFTGERELLVSQIVLVREDHPRHWIDVASFELGG